MATTPCLPWLLVSTTSGTLWIRSGRSCMTFNSANTSIRRVHRWPHEVSRRRAVVPPRACVFQAVPDRILSEPVRDPPKLEPQRMQGAEWRAPRRRSPAPGTPAEQGADWLPSSGPDCASHDRRTNDVAGDVGCSKPAVLNRLRRHADRGRPRVLAQRGWAMADHAPVRHGEGIRNQLE